MLRKLARAVVTRRVSSVELVTRALARIERLDPELNAVIALRAEEALVEAAALDDRVARGEEVGPLAGIPFLVKDNKDLTGLRTTQGSLLFADRPPAQHDDLTPARLRGAGAIAVGKTNVPEFCVEGFTANRVFGVTRSPWGAEWSPGGSSGGSAAAMAAGMVPFATASDGGGSVRTPAAFCGLYGLKPTAGVIARDPIPAWIDYSTDGPLGLTPDDVRVLLGVQAGPWPGDPSALPAGGVPGQGADHRAAAGVPVAPSPSVVYAATRFVDYGPLSDAATVLYENALTSMESDLGLVVERLEPGSLFKTGNVDDDFLVVVAAEHAHYVGRPTIEGRAESFTTPALDLLTLGLGITIEQYLGARRRRFDYVRELDVLLGRDGVLVMPTMPGEGFCADGRMPGRDEIGTDAESYNTMALNVTGHPALSVPAGLSPNGVPFGLQVAGPRFRDDLVLAVGDAWQEAHPGPAEAPGHQPFWED